MSERDEGFYKALEYPLFSAFLHRRTRRISKGIKSLPAKSLTYNSDQDPQPLTELEEAMLIAATGVTGLTMHDVPFQTPDGKNITMTLYLHLTGRTASSPDNVQMTHFFLINDYGTYLLKRPDHVDPFFFREGGMTPEKLVEWAKLCKVKVLDHRLDYKTRDFPVYVGTNRYVSNVPGSTILVPVVDLSKYYINVMLYLIGAEASRFRSPWVDDWRFYRSAGVKKWVRNGFMNKKLTPFMLGWLGTFRGHIEADLLIQNILLTIQAMGLGGWIHAAFPGPILLGSPETAPQYGKGLGFRHVVPKKTICRFLMRAVTPAPAWLSNPVGLDGLLEGHCPPYHKDMDAAVDAVVALKEGKHGVYNDYKGFNRIFKRPYGNEFLDEVPHDSKESIAVVKDICAYIYDTYDRFPAHVEAMYVPGVWVQALHPDLKYYERFYNGGMSPTQLEHERLWHGGYDEHERDDDYRDRDYDDDRDHDRHRRRHRDHDRY